MPTDPPQGTSRWPPRMPKYALAPLDPTVEWTIANAGRTVLVKCRLTKDGAFPPAASSFVKLTSVAVGCNSGVVNGDVLDGGTGMSYHSDRYWQYNWQTPTRWRNTCRLMLVTFDDGSTLSAKAAFK